MMMIVVIPVCEEILHYTPCPHSFWLFCPTSTIIPLTRLTHTGRSLPSARVMCVSACVCTCACMSRVSACVRACACEFVLVCVRACVRVCVWCVCACVSARACVRLRVCVCVRECHVSVCVYVCVCLSTYVRACVWVSASFPPICNMFSGIRQAPRPLSLNVEGLLMLFGSTYHDVPDLHVHERLHEYMYGCMSTPLYVHVTHTQHTHTRTHNTHTTQSWNFHTTLLPPNLS